MKTDISLKPSLFRRRLWLFVGVLMGVGILFQPAQALTGSKLFLIDFESYEEGSPIGSQYSFLGAVFSIPGEPNLLPIIAVEGSPTVGFVGSGDDNPMASGIAGLTDPLINDDFTVGVDIAIDFDPFITSIRMFILDIESTEWVTLRAFDGPNEVGSVTRSGGQSGTGNGVASEFFFSAEAITRVVIEVPDTIGFAVDFITFTRPCEDEQCGPIIEIAQESVPGTGDFNDHILGQLLPYPSASSTTQFYAYDVPEGASWNGLSLTPIIDRSHLLMADTSDGMSLIIVHDRAQPDDPDGGRAEMKFELFNDPDGAFRSVEDDPASTEQGEYVGNPGDSLFTSNHFWSPCCTDGLALSDLEGPWVLFVQFTDTDNDPATATIAGLSEWFAYSSDGTLLPLVLEAERRIRIRAIGMAIPGDLNFDGFVNLVDVALLAMHWQETNCVNPTWCGLTDINQSGTVDEEDIEYLANRWLLDPFE
jgi:hypothetical protein